MLKKPKKPFFKKWWFWTIVLILIVVGFTYQQSVEQAKEDMNELKGMFSSNDEKEQDNTHEQNNEDDSGSKENTTADNQTETVDFSADQESAKFTMKEIVEKYPVGSSFVDYSEDILGNITVANVYNLKNGTIMDVLIAKDGFVGIESDGNTITKVNEFATFEDAEKYANQNK